jgi:hypothetical protein
MPGILSFIFLLAALILNMLRAAQGESASLTAVVEIALPVVIGLSIVIIPVVVLVKLSTARYKRAMAQLQSRYPHVYYTTDFRNGQRILTADKQTVSIWRARRKKLELVVSWPRGAVTIEKATVPVSRAVTVPGIVFTDPYQKLRRMAVSDRVTARVQPIDYGAFLPYIQ